MTSPEQRRAEIGDWRNQRARDGYPSRHLGPALAGLTVIVLIIAAIILWTTRNSKSTPAHSSYDRVVIRTTSLVLNAGGRYDLNRRGDHIDANGAAYTFKVTAAGLRLAPGVRAQSGPLPGQGNDPCWINDLTPADGTKLITWHDMQTTSPSQWCIKTTHPGGAYDNFLQLTPDAAHHHRIHADIKSFIFQDR